MQLPEGLACHFFYRERMTGTDRKEHGERIQKRDEKPPLAECILHRGTVHKESNRMIEIKKQKVHSGGTDTEKNSAGHAREAHFIE